ncbi:MAG: transposase [Amphritea sp.]
MVDTHFSDEKIFEILSQRIMGVKLGDICRKYGVSENAFFEYKSRYDGMDFGALKRFRRLEKENCALREKVAKARVKEMAGVCHPLVEAMAESSQGDSAPIVWLLRSD